MRTTAALAYTHAELLDLADATNGCIFPRKYEVREIVENRITGAIVKSFVTLTLDRDITLKVAGNADGIAFILIQFSGVNDRRPTRTSDVLRCAAVAAFTRNSGMKER